MGERKDPEPTAERRPTLIVAAASRLSPVQQAWKRYVDHSLYVCDTCRRVDGSPCGTAEELYRTYRAQADAAFDEVARSGGSSKRDGNPVASGESFGQSVDVQ
ncbi:hypothetical protein ABZX82_02320 [Streptomyces griseoflavus]|uniref:hypothetical protein n=1 Tax=Streptomyces griseoflavus TaxID=35619 RepID=UPI0033B9729B